MEEEDTGEEVSDSSGTVRPPAGFKILGYEQRWEVALLLPFNKALLLFGVCLYNLRGLETLKYKAGSFIVVFFYIHPVRLWLPHADGLYLTCSCAASLFMSAPCATQPGLSRCSCETMTALSIFSKAL